MTSNVGSGMIRQHTLGFSQSNGSDAGREGFEKRLLDELRKTFRPEFLNRVDEVIVFDPLDRQQLEQIVDLLLERTRRLVEGRGMHLEVTAAAKARIVDEGFDVEYGRGRCGAPSSAWSRTRSPASCCAATCSPATPSPSTPGPTARWSRAGREIGAGRKVAWGAGRSRLGRGPRVAGVRPGRRPGPAAWPIVAAWHECAPCCTAASWAAP